MSLALLTAGAWLMDGARDHASLMSAVMGNAAIMVWLCVPTFAYFAFQGYRRMAAVKPRAEENNNFAAAASQHTDVEVGVHA